MRTAWISDVHLGTPGCQAAALLDFLRTWYWPQSHNDLVQKLPRHRVARALGDDLPACAPVARAASVGPNGTPAADCRRAPAAFTEASHGRLKIVSLISTT